MKYRPTTLLTQILTASLVSLLAACATTPPTAATPATDEKKAATPTPIRSAAPVSGPVTNTAAQAQPIAAEHSNPASPLAKRSVFFPFDQYAIPSEAQGLIQNHAAYLNKNTTLRILIQGNADERGSREYNLALGQRRADAIRAALGALGVPADRIETVSLGEEKPRASSHDEAAWRENRRADILYRGEY